VTPRESRGSKAAAQDILACQYALYPLGSQSYTDLIEREMEAAGASGLAMARQNFSTRIEGSPEEIFSWLAGAFDRARGEVSHVIVTATIGRRRTGAQPFTLGEA
jgi:uncharacterized protein YqgV (UPF0045/DUF77 family)